MGKICVQCGDTGFANGFVDCVKCLDAVIHLYCLDVIPENFDEDVEWNCDDCAIEAQTLDHDVIPLQNRGIDTRNIQESSKDGAAQPYEGTLLQLVRMENADGNWRKRRSVKNPTVEKYKHRLCISPSKQSYECTRSRDDSTLPCKTKENEGPTLENHCAETNVQGRNHIENEEPKDVEKNFLEDLGFSSPEPIVEPIWRGCFNIWNDKFDIIDGIIAHMSSKASGKVYEEATQFQVVLDLEMLPKSDVWLKSFETSQPTGDTIALYFFPSEISERIFDHLVEEMMHKELALKAFSKNAELLIFTSNELPILQWRVQGKYYLWGLLTSKQSIGHNPKATTPTDLLSGNEQSHTCLGDAKTKRKRGRQLDDAWGHANPLNELRQKAECRYCGFISLYGGISRLKAHLGGGHPLIRLPGCEKVSPEVKKVMADWFSEWVKDTKAFWTKEIRVSVEGERRGRPPDVAWEHAKPLDEARQKTQCNYCGHVLSYGGISRLKAHLAGGSSEMQLQGCPNVPPPVKRVMEQWFDEWTKNSTAIWTRKSPASANSSKRGRTVDDDIWEHAIPLDEMGEATRCKYCGYVSKCGGIARLKAHLAGGDPTTHLVSCPNVSWELKNTMAEGIKKSAEKSKDVVPMDNFGISHENQRKTGEILSFEKRHHILRETLDPISNTSLKDRLQKLIQGKNANLNEMQFEIHSLESQFASMP